MKNYSLISKNVFILPEGNPIKLVEYMIIRDDRQSKYYTILNIDNQTANILQKIVIELEFLDSENEVITSESYQLEDLEIPAFKSKVTLDKIEVDKQCVSINISISYVESNTGIWENNQWTTKKEYINLFEEEDQYEMSSIQFKKQLFPFWIPFVITGMFILIILLVYTLINR